MIPWSRQLQVLPSPRDKNRDPCKKETTIQIGDYSFKFMFEAFETEFFLPGRFTSRAEAINLPDGKRCCLKFS